MSSTFPVSPTDKWYVCYGPTSVTYTEVPAGATGDTGQPNVEAYDTEIEALIRAIELGFIPEGYTSANVLSVDGPSTQIKWADTSDISFLSLFEGAIITSSDPEDAIETEAICLTKNKQTGITTWSSEVTLEGSDVPFTISYENVNPTV